MPTQVGIHVFVTARTVRRGWWAFAHHDGGDHANRSILRAVGISRSSLEALATLCGTRQVRISTRWRSHSTENGLSKAGSPNPGGGNRRLAAFLSRQFRTRTSRTKPFAGDDDDDLVRTPLVAAARGAPTDAVGLASRACSADARAPRSIKCVPCLVHLRLDLPIHS